MAAVFSVKTKPAPIAMQRMRLAGSGIFLPESVVTAEELDARLHLPPGWVATKTGVMRRHFASANDSAAGMGAAALTRALTDARWTASSLDLILCASGTAQQPIPCTAVLVSEAMGPCCAGIPAFDINATCLSFLAALDVASLLIHSGRHQRIAIVSTEIASRGLDWTDPASAALFGDGAIATLLETTAEPIGIEAIRMETYAEGAHHCEIRGGGSGLPSMRFDPARSQDYQFQMDGERLHKLAATHMPGFVSRLFEPLGVHPADLDAVVPHQAGRTPVRLLARRLGISDRQLVMTLDEHGNTIAAGMPMALHIARARQQVRRGHRIALLGTGAGIAFAGCVWQL